MKTEFTLTELLSCELAGLFCRFTLLRKLRGFTFAKAFDYYLNHENLDPDLKVTFAAIYSARDNFSSGVINKPISYLKGFSPAFLNQAKEIFQNVISSLEYYYEID